LERLSRVPTLLGLHRPELRAWAMYDWANSVFMSTVLLVFPIYFTTVAAGDLPAEEASERFAWSTTIAMTIAALLSPALGAFADHAEAKKKMLAGSLAVGIPATAALSTVGAGEWKAGLALFILANIGATAGFVFYESLLPHIASEKEVDRVSTAGYALGYLGGALPLALSLFMIQKPSAFGFDGAASATRFAFIIAAAWWLLFSIPLFLRIPEPALRRETRRTRSHPVRETVARLAETLRELKGYRQAFLLLLAFLLYNDGIQTIIRMATLYGTEIGLSQAAMMKAGVMVQLVAVPFSFLFGFVARWLGVKRALFIPIFVYIAITALAYRMTAARDFYVLAFLVATVQGGSQALSRSLFATMIPRHKSGEFFGFFGVFEKFAGVLGPFVFAAVIAATGSSRPAILTLVVFFVGGGALLAFVDVAEGRARARKAEDGLARRRA
jgi:UMF1 family MFS transporter